MRLGSPEHDEVVHMTASIGVAVYPEHGTSADALLERADDALYAAKAAGPATAVDGKPDAGTTPPRPPGEADDIAADTATERG